MLLQHELEDLEVWVSALSRQSRVNLRVNLGLQSGGHHRFALLVASLIEVELTFFLAFVSDGLLLSQLSLHGPQPGFDLAYVVQ